MVRVSEATYTTDSLCKQPTSDGVSVVTCCMNRNDNLLKAVTSWLLVEEINEIIIVDWSSDISVKNTIPTDSKIKIVEVPNQEDWILSRAFNVGACFVSTDKMLKLDADIILAKDFLENHTLKESTFLHGTWKTAKTFDQIHVNGQLYCFTDDFWKVNGYNEQITSYGWDDDDLYERLTSLNLRELYLNSSDMLHLHNLNANRVKSQPRFKNRKVNCDMLMESRNKNREWCRTNKWTIKNERINYSIKSESSSYFVCQRIV